MKTWKNENMKKWKHEKMKTWKHENMEKYKKIKYEYSNINDKKTNHLATIVSSALYSHSEVELLLRPVSKFN